MVATAADMVATEAEDDDDDEEDRFAVGGPRGRDEPYKEKRHRMQKCKACAGCLVQIDCGACKFCLDKPAFGGKGTLRRSCVMRGCVNVKKPKGKEAKRGWRRRAVGEVLEVVAEAVAVEVVAEDLIAYPTVASTAAAAGGYGVATTDDVEIEDVTSTPESGTPLATTIARHTIDPSANSGGGDPAWTLPVSRAAVEGLCALALQCYELAGVDYEGDPKGRPGVLWHREGGVQRA